MFESAYTLSFDPISEWSSALHFEDHSNPQQTRSVEFTVDDTIFRARTRSSYPEIGADLIDLSAAIYAADRLAVQYPGKRRHIQVILPLRHPEVFGSEDALDLLKELLNWATASASRWSFDFKKRQMGRLVERETVLSFPARDAEVALWSGGLDALAGLYTRAHEQLSLHFQLVGSGSNDTIFARQQKVLTKLDASMSRRTLLCQVPIRFRRSGPQHKNSCPRVRGVVFCLVSAVCAYLQGQQTLNVYENGVGAINLSYRDSEIGIDHSRSVHPLTLLGISRFLSTVLEEVFSVTNPFLFWTKAQILERLAADRRIDLLPYTMSCDSPHRRRPKQCGYCSSCILRRQALAAAGLEDQTRYVVPHGKPPKRDSSLYLRAMLTQVDSLERLLSGHKRSNAQWEALTQKYAVLDDIVDRTAEFQGIPEHEMRLRLVQLYQNYICEWQQVRAPLSADILNSSNVGITRGNSVATLR